MNKVLANGCRVQPVSKETYDDFRREYEPLIFPNRFDINVQDSLSPAEQEAAASLGKHLGNPYALRLGVFADDKMIGWSYGLQISADTFRMVTTGIQPEYQRKGIYSALLRELADHIRAEGFQMILSRHYATDNQVIIPKLRFGFLISGFELTDDFGLLIRLTYYFNETRRNIMHVRSGFQQPSDEIKRLIRRY